MSRAVRTKFLDYDARRTPKTAHYCVCCQRDLRGAFRVAHLLPGEPFVVHPDDITDEHVRYPIGLMCARKLGLEWSRPTEGDT